MKINYQIIRLLPFRQDIVVFYGGERKDLIAFCRSPEAMKEQGNANAKALEEYKEIFPASIRATTYTLPYGFMVQFKDQQPAPELIAHEAVHVAMISMEQAGVPINIDNQEMVAYLVDNIVEQISRNDTYKYDSRD